MSTENYLPVGHDLLMMIILTMQLYARVDTSAPVEPAPSLASRHPLREHRVPSRFNNYVPLSYVSDEMSA